MFYRRNHFYKIKLCSILKYSWCFFFYLPATNRNISYWAYMDNLATLKKTVCCTTHLFPEAVNKHDFGIILFTISRDIVFLWHICRYMWQSICIFIEQFITILYTFANRIRSPSRRAPLSLSMGCIHNAIANPEFYLWITDNYEQIMKIIKKTIQGMWKQQQTHCYFLLHLISGILLKHLIRIDCFNPATT